MTNLSSNKRPIILFDLDDTLCNTSRSKKDTLKVIYQNISKFQIIDFEIFFEAYLKESKKYYTKKQIRGFTTYANIELWSNLYKKLSIKPTVEEHAKVIDTYRQETLNNISLYPNVLKTLKTLKQQGNIVCVVSGGDYYSKAQKLMSLKIDHLFDYIFCTEFTQSDKTTGDIYRFVMEFFKRPATDFIMIGDIVEQDIKPANKVGMVTVQVTMRGDKEIGKKGFSKPDYVINDMGKLLKILDNQ